MIPALSPFLTAEALQHSARPVFIFTILPHYYPTGVAAGSGTCVGTEFVAPDRIQVITGSGGHSFTSPVLQALAGTFPVQVIATWTVDYPGYTYQLEYRTAPVEADVSSAAWVVMEHGDELSFYRYYQWRITWIAFRSWFFDTEGEMDDSAFWALDAYDPEDPYQSYLSDTGFGGVVAFIENVRFAGVFEIDADDVLDPGSCIDERSTEVGSLVAGDHTLVLVNRDSKYAPGHANFIFGGETYWYKKTLRIEMAYELPGGQITDRIILYEGTIQNWGPTPHRVDEKGKLDAHTVTIHSRDVIADIMDQKIGVPDDDGHPDPLVFGTIMRQAEQVGDETLGAADGTADFKTGDTSELAGVDAGSGGTVAIDTTDPFSGIYCLRTAVANANAYAKGRLDLAASGAEGLFCGAVKFVTIPEAPADKNMYFMGLFNAGGTEILQLFVGSDYRVHAYAAGEYKETEWYVNQDLGVWLRVSIAPSLIATGTLKLWVNGNEVLTWDKDWSALSVKGGFIGPHNGAVAEEWVIASDAWEIYPNWWPQLYKVAGGPYSSIGSVYIDGAIKVGGAPLYTAQDRRGLRYGPSTVVVKFVGGATALANVEKYPEYGAIAFSDYATKVSGTVMAYLEKNNISHPVDIIAGILTAGGKAALIHAASFAAAKADMPDASIGCYFEDTTMGDAIAAVAAVCLVNIYRSANVIKAEAYTAIPPAAYDLALDEFELIGSDPITEMEGIKNKIFYKWGWYERNHKLSGTAKDDQSIAFLGAWDTEIDLSWGGAVGSDNAQMAKRNAELLLKRLGAGCRTLSETGGSLRLARLEVGDLVQVNVPYFGPAEIYQVNKKTIRVSPPRGVDLEVGRFLGE